MLSSALRPIYSTKRRASGDMSFAYSPSISADSRKRRRSAVPWPGAHRDRPARQGGAAFVPSTDAGRNGNLGQPWRFHAKWMPVRVKKTRQAKEIPGETVV